ncbi:Myb_domain [Hexamita inflata]|uniref:Myb_domain n=1 Tax=Hexamita inflata TaxID=28002 RepID=A0ABP1H8V7_9EUKA
MNNRTDKQCKQYYANIIKPKLDTEKQGIMLEPFQNQTTDLTKETNGQQIRWRQKSLSSSFWI